MNNNIAKERINQVIMVDSINSSPSDFLATHVPFKKIVIKNGLSGDYTKANLSEQEFYEKFFCDTNNFNSHQLIVVEGSAGTGKSHFIRWLNVKLDSITSDVKLLIRRDDNTLKGTIQQLLNLDEVKNLKNKEIYERLVRANHTISDKKFKNEIYTKFLNEILSDESDDNEELTKHEKKLLVSLFSNDLFREKLFEENGPIERIFRKIVREDGASSDVVAQFMPTDFVLDESFGELLRLQAADKKAIKMASRLIPDENSESKAFSVSKYMNSFLDSVIQSCAGIEPGDFQQIFKDIRKELKTQGKNLILLIEDITSFTGINQALLNALVTGHTGMYGSENLCRLISVVGTTTEYYNSFRDNYKDRITTQVTIEDGAIGGSNINDLYEFFARYLNALSITSNEMFKWYSNGAQLKDLPIYDGVEQKKWEFFEIENRKFCLYPFTKKSILNFYNSLEKIKTPRHILREIIQPAVNEVLYNKNKYLYFTINRNYGLDDLVESKLRNIVSHLEMDLSEQKELSSRVVNFVAIYNDKKNLGLGTAYGISKKTWEEFGFGDIYEKLDSREESVSTLLDDEDDGDQNTSTQKKENKEYKSFMENLNNWFYNKEYFNKARPIRDKLNEIVWKTLDWEINDFPKKAGDLIEKSSKDLFGFERQDKALSNALIVLPADEETRQILMVVGKYMYLGNNSWDFSGVADSIYLLTTWLEKNKRQIFNAIKDEEYRYEPFYIQCAMATSIIYKILSGIDVSKNHNFSTDIILNKYEGKTSIPGHSQSWNDLLYYLNQENKATEVFDLLIDYHCLTQGGSYGLKVLNYTNFLSSFNRIKNNLLELEKSSINYFKNEKNDTVKLYFAIKERFKKIVQEEKDFIKKSIDKINKVFNFDMLDEIEVQDVRGLLKEAIDFYIDAQSYSFVIEPRYNFFKNLYSSSEAIVRSIKISKELLDEQNSLELLIKLSSNPAGTLGEFVQAIESLEHDLLLCESMVSAEEEEQKRQGLWSESGDVRFDEQKEQFNKIREEWFNSVE